MTKSGKVPFHYFPLAALALHMEVEHHPALAAPLAASTSLEESIGIIAAYCGIALDGYYAEVELEKLFDILVHKLKSKGSSVILH